MLPLLIFLLSFFAFRYWVREDAIDDALNARQGIWTEHRNEFTRVSLILLALAVGLYFLLGSVVLCLAWLAMYVLIRFRWFDDTYNFYAGKEEGYMSDPETDRESDKSWIDGKLYRYRNILNDGNLRVAVLWVGMGLITALLLWHGLKAPLP